MCRLIAIAALLAAAPVFADDKAKSKPDKAKGKAEPEAIFKRLDANSDGKVSKDEFAKMAEVIRTKLQDKGKAKNADGKFANAMFSRLDTNGDGSLSVEEFKKMSEQRQKKKVK